MNRRRAFVAAAIAINVVVSLIPHTLATRIAIAFDPTFTITGLYRWLIVRRPGPRPRPSLLFVFLLGLLRAAPNKAFALSCLEAAAIVTGVIAFRGGDLTGFIPSAIAERALLAKL